MKRLKKLRRKHHKRIVKRHLGPPFVPTPECPWPTQDQMDGFYGNPRGRHGSYSTAWAKKNLTTVTCPWPLHLSGNDHTPLITIHKKCAESLKRVLATIWEACGKSEEKIKELHYDVFDGGFCYRNKKGGSTLSCHAYGVALDFDAKDNAFHAEKHLFMDDSIIVKAFKAEHWVWGGNWSEGSKDAMHFQAARVR
jgi:hypothetical protein